MGWILLERSSGPSGGGEKLAKKVREFKRAMKGKVRVKDVEAFVEQGTMDKPRPKFERVCELARTKGWGILAWDWSRLIRRPTKKGLERFRRMTKGLVVAVWKDPDADAKQRHSERVTRTEGAGRPAKGKSRYAKLRRKQRL
jgi:hypothetical protein